MNKNLVKLVKTLNSESMILVREIINSPIKWDLIKFYRANPFSIHTARGLSRIIGRKPDQVLKEIEELAAANVVKKLSENSDSSSIYVYEPKAEAASAISFLIDLSEEHEQMEELQRLIASS